jgi:carbonic anhydrase
MAAMTAPAARPTTPAQAWAALVAGNERFVEGRMRHPSQDAGRRAELSQAQSPFAVVFGCSDSRVAAEIVFDEGLGDLFVVRTAGHVIDATVLGSIEYGVEVLGAPLVVVLGHDGCGAVRAAARALADGEVPRGPVRAVVDRVIPSIVGLAATGRPVSSLDAEDLAREHLRATAHMLADYSDALAHRIADGTCAVVAAGYTLADGTVRLAEVAGSVE